MRLEAILWITLFSAYCEAGLIFSPCFPQMPANSNVALPPSIYLCNDIPSCSGGGWNEGYDQYGNPCHQPCQQSPPPCDNFCTQPWNISWSQPWNCPQNKVIPLAGNLPIPTAPCCPPPCAQSAPTNCPNTCSPNCHRPSPDLSVFRGNNGWEKANLTQCNGQCDQPCQVQSCIPAFNEYTNGPLASSGCSFCSACQGGCSACATNSQHCGCSGPSVCSGCQNQAPCGECHNQCSCSGCSSQNTGCGCPSTASWPPPTSYTNCCPGVPGNSRWMFGPSGTACSYDPNVAAIRDAAMDCSYTSSPCDDHPFRGVIYDLISAVNQMTATPPPLKSSGIPEKMGKLCPGCVALGHVYSLVSHLKAMAACGDMNLDEHRVDKHALQMNETLKIQNETRKAVNSIFEVVKANYKGLAATLKKLDAMKDSVESVNRPPARIPGGRPYGYQPPPYRRPSPPPYGRPIGYGRPPYGRPPPYARPPPYRRAKRTIKSKKGSKKSKKRDDEEEEEENEEE